MAATTVALVKPTFYVCDGGRGLYPRLLASPARMNGAKKSDSMCKFKMICIALATLQWSATEAECIRQPNAVKS
jgi:hypothetical protein